MKRAILLCFYTLFGFVTLSYAQRKCGFEELKSSLIANHPEFEQQFKDRQNQLKLDAEKYLKEKNSYLERTTSQDIIIPVVFHIVINQGQYEAIGGKRGIEQRCRTQIDVINQDFNAMNSDSVLIPTGWKPLFANVGIKFGLAHTDAIGYPTPGYTIRIVSKKGFDGMGNSFHNAKVTDSGGSDAWDVTKYLNVWCINFIDNGSTGSLLGITSPWSFTPLPNNDVGICIAYNTLGKRVSDSDFYPQNSTSGNYYDRGRTLTHEIGHFFEIWHVWGDDGGACPWTGGVRELPDIPPQGNSTLINPVYNIPGGTITDNCSDSAGINKQPIGIACLNYMDYTDDKGMHLFTPNQATVMISQLYKPTSESYSLTQHPELLNMPSGAPQILSVFPNPTNDVVTITYQNTADKLEYITVHNIFGKEVQKIYPDTNNDFSLVNLYGNPNGVYIILCKFQSGVKAQKVVLQSYKH